MNPENENNKFLPLPGIDVVGRGLLLRPRQPYALKNILFPQQSFRNYFTVDAGVSYQVPAGYDVNDSPPMPAGAALNRLVIEESIERLDKKLNQEASVSCGSDAFNVDASASQTAQVQRDTEAYYASRISFIPFLTVYIADAQMLPQDTFNLEIPVPFTHANRKQYDKFFERFGSHYVKRAWVGGKAMLTFSVLKSSNISEDEIRAGIKASYVGMGEGQASTHLAEKKEKLLNNSECTVSGKGGDSLKLAALSSLDEAHYNEWLQTVKDNPQVVELEIAGIWTLIDDEEKADALQAAYKEATTFEPISAVFHINSEIYLLRTRTFASYNIEKGTSHKPKSIYSKWPGLETLGFDLVDATLSGEYMGYHEKTRLSNHVYFFCGQYYSAMDIATGEFSEAKKIKEGWPGVNFERIDAALHFDDESVYFFSGNQYVRFSLKDNKVDDNYPELISKRWVGVNFDKIDAAIYWGNGKVYFFREDQHTRYDVASFRADPGYPKHIKGSYVDDWNLFV